MKKLQYDKVNPGIQSLVSWLSAKTQRFEHVRVTDMFSSFLDGGFLLSALLCSYDPKAIDYEFLQPQNARKNLERCFVKAKEKFDVPCLLDAEDFTTDTLDEVSLVLYLTVFYEQVNPNKEKFFV